MAIYKVLFQPLGEYFFGEDGSFREGLDNAEYFIRSRRFPSQTTIFGILRYLNLECVKEWGSYEKNELEANKQAVGEKGFHMGRFIENKESNENYGRIKAMSAVFLHEFDSREKVSKVYVPLPKDAKKLKKPFEKEYKSIFEAGDLEVDTPNGKKVIPKGYVAKDGLESGFISIDAGMREDGSFIDSSNLSVMEEPFEWVQKTGLRINHQYPAIAEDEPISSLFKKEYVLLKAKNNKKEEGTSKEQQNEKEYSFGVYVEIEGEEDKIINKLQRIQTMGLGGTPFKISAKKIEEAEEKNRLQVREDLVLKVDKIFENHLRREQLVYCISPVYLEEPQAVLEKCSFASINTTANRPLQTIDNTRKKSDCRYQMLEAGSILVLVGQEQIFDNLNYKGLKQIGYNHCYIGGRK